MKQTWHIPMIIIGSLGIYSGWYLWQPGGADVLLVVTHILFAVFALLAAILALKASRMFDPGVASRRVWLFFGAGMTALTVSELLSLAYYVADQPLPYPSVVDISWGIGFISVLASLVLQYRALGVQISRRTRLLVLAAYLGVLLVISALSMGYILSNPGEVVVMQLLVSAYYLIGDLGVAFLATLTLVYFGKGLVGRPWRYMLISILLFAVGGLAFSYGTWMNTYFTGSNFLSGLSDVSYLAAYMLAAAGGYSQVTLRLPAVDEEE